VLPSEPLDLFIEVSAASPAQRGADTPVSTTIVTIGSRQRTSRLRRRTARRSTTRQQGQHGCRDQLLGRQIARQLRGAVWRISVIVRFAAHVHILRDLNDVSAGAVSADRDVRGSGHGGRVIGCAQRDHELSFSSTSGPG
jgi:hypothetical protein